MLYQIRKEIEECQKEIRNCENAIMLDKITLKCVLVDNFGVDETVRYSITNLQLQYERKKALQEKLLNLNKQLADETWETKKKYAKEKLGLCCR